MTTKYSDLLCLQQQYFKQTNKNIYKLIHTLYDTTLMQLITLNTWAGRAGKKPLLDFFITHKTTDIFCLQEVWKDREYPIDIIENGFVLGDVIPDLFTNISTLLPDHRALFHPHYEDFYGLAMFIHKKYPIITEGDIFVYKQKGFASTEHVGNHARNIQYATIETPEGPVTIINFHGLWNGQGKTDTEDRLLQSANIFAFTQQLTTPFVIAGDFNLRPDTKSLALLEEAGMKNLISEYQITSTRTSFYQKEERYADYVLVSSDIHAQDFGVLPEEVSDHAALQLSFTL